ncbi:MAG: hypothetical protein A2Y10_13080 [Planctomycetes bacterium GWF2_41_51]|nr:MAG: hypothetical protein A2Y10_13080 [Planctomycetes bacterium GWF2_41_51]HBG60710.1 hypothetical protein [Candidatus Omnitrophota bacterium]
MEEKPVFEKYEANVLRKYENGRRLEEEDRKVIDRLSLIGVVERGFNFDEMYPTAILSKLGKELLY